MPTSAKHDVSNALVARARALDEADPLAARCREFVETDGVVSYLDGNSLGRPLAVTGARLGEFVDEQWAERLIRGWDEGWLDAPTELGDLVGRVTLGAGPGQTVVADSTTVLLYKVLRAAVGARPDRDEIVIDSENFPTDRYVVEAVAVECGLSVRWIDGRPAAGVTVDDVHAVVGPATSVVLLSHVAYRSAYVADLSAITAIVHDTGALVVWDLCHSVGVLDVGLDAADVDFAVGCTYKYLNGGPGAPAFCYVAGRLQGELDQPIHGWMGAEDPFAMDGRYRPAAGIRRFVSGTPSIVAMQPMRDMVTMIEDVGMPAIRAKSVRLTRFVLELADELLVPLGVHVSSPREDACRGSHVTLDHPDFRRVTTELWQSGVVPDFRPPDGLRIGVSPLSTSFAEVAVGLVAVADLLRGRCP